MKKQHRNQLQLQPTLLLRLYRMSAHGPRVILALTVLPMARDGEQQISKTKDYENVRPSQILF